MCVPLPGITRTLGILVLGWDTPHQVDVTERAVLTAIGGYAARALERALHLEQRVAVVTQLQQAMLTDLPAIPGPELAALYRPAAAGEQPERLPAPLEQLATEIAGPRPSDDMVLLAARIPAGPA